MYCTAIDHGSIELKRLTIQLVLSKAWLCVLMKFFPSQHNQSVYFNLNKPLLINFCDSLPITLKYHSYMNPYCTDQIKSWCKIFKHPFPKLWPPYLMQGLFIPFACIGSGDPVRVLHLYTTNTLDTLWSIYCWDICTTCHYRIYVLLAQALRLWDFLLLIRTLQKYLANCTLTLYCVVTYMCACVDARRTVFWDRSLISAFHKIWKIYRLLRDACPYKVGGLNGWTGCFRMVHWYWTEMTLK